MDAMNTSTCTNDSSVLQDVSNNSVNVTENNPTQKVDVLNVVFFLCVLGLPGNLLVIAVYVRKMTTSTRLYMFALAVADSVACGCGIVLSVALMDLVSTIVFQCAINASITFSVFLLVFMSIERLIAVRRPHSFNMEAQRAKKALIIIAVTTLVFTTMTSVMKMKQYEQIERIFGLFTLVLCGSIMTTCYILIAATLMKRARTARNRIAVVRGTSSSDSCSSHVFPKLKMPTTLENLVCQHNAGISHITVKTIVPVENDIHPVDPVSSPVTTEVEDTSRVQSCRTTIPGAVKSTCATTKTVAKQSTTVASVTMIFVITVVFIACFLPEWIHHTSIQIPVEVRRLNILNSVVNPFIYGVASAMFREDVRQFHRQTRVKLFACYH